MDIFHINLTQALTFRVGKRNQPLQKIYSECVCMYSWVNGCMSACLHAHNYKQGTYESFKSLKVCEFERKKNPNLGSR